MINILNELKKIKEYIDKNYDVRTEIKKSYLHEYELIVRAKKYDIRIQVANKDSESYIPNDFGLYLGYDANKKFQSELCYAGGGYLTKYFPDNYEDIDKYLNKKYFEILKITEKQTTIFDFV